MHLGWLRFLRDIEKWRATRMSYKKVFWKLISIEMNKVKCLYQGSFFWPQAIIRNHEKVIRCHQEKTHTYLKTLRALPSDISWFLKLYKEVTWSRYIVSLWLFAAFLEIQIFKILMVRPLNINVEHIWMTQCISPSSLVLCSFLCSDRALYYRSSTDFYSVTKVNKCQANKSFYKFN